MDLVIHCLTARILVSFECVTNNSATTTLLTTNLHAYPKSMMRILHHSDVIMSAMASQITGASIVYSTVCSGVDQRKHFSSASMAFVREIHQWPVKTPHKGPVTRKMFSFDDVIMGRIIYHRRGFGVTHKCLFCFVLFVCVCVCVFF